jgi:hypothetical protein
MVTQPINLSTERLSSNESTAKRLDPAESPEVSIRLAALKKNSVYQVIFRRIEHHIEICKRQISWFGRWALFTRYSLPLLTAFATGIASFLAGAQNVGSNENQTGLSLSSWLTPLSWSVAGASFIASCISALNAAMRPAIQYGHYVTYIVRFWKLKVLLDFDLERVLLPSEDPKDNRTSEQKLVDALEKRNAEVEETIKSFSEGSISNIALPISAPPAPTPS